ncbi:vasodilator-stimulated phosphoprotein-like [Phaenicophaeus curvirostris]|uniref:vasodilator-stimulated phosphoprotein-like n=1 Tax=Phaenicophaeus curvirostris TaxID=33595 RepID=UPI0037F0EB88
METGAASAAQAQQRGGGPGLGGRRGDPQPLLEAPNHSLDPEIRKPLSRVDPSSGLLRSLRQGGPPPAPRSDWAPPEGPPPPPPPPSPPPARGAPPAPPKHPHRPRAARPAAAGRGGGAAAGGAALERPRGGVRLAQGGGGAPGPPAAPPAPRNRPGPRGRPRHAAALLRRRLPRGVGQPQDEAVAPPPTWLVTLGGPQEGPPRFWGQTGTF